MFTVFNILQRRASLLHTSLRIRKSSFDAVAADLVQVSAETLDVLAQRAAWGEPLVALGPQEQHAMQLLREVNAITRHVLGSPASRSDQRGQVRGMMTSLGLPSFYITLNFADVYNPAVRVLGGEAVDIDRMLPDHPPDYWSQAQLVARNPVAAATFFHVYMMAFL
ncbi:hypothetical protein CALVIDRAFT_467679, partial [Calocera viscosa TUFC12733]